VVGNRRKKELREVDARAFLSAAQERAAQERGSVAATQAMLTSDRCGRRLRITEAAEQANLSVRSLQRKLASGGVVYSQLADEISTEQAVEMLRDRESTLSEISTALGYSMVSNFARAFHRWTGQTPTEFRREL
jgi:AraC-like DNA-binding protein